MNQPDTTKGVPTQPSPNPLLNNPDYAGLPPNPYSIDLANVPGLTLGYNPVTRLIEALHWTIDQTQTQENAAATAVMSAPSSANRFHSRRPRPKREGSRKPWGPIYSPGLPSG